MKRVVRGIAHALRITVVMVAGSWLMATAAPSRHDSRPALRDEDLVPLLPAARRGGPKPAKGKAKPPGRLKAVPTPADAVRLALGDILRCRPQDACFQRYLWCPSGKVAEDGTLNGDPKATTIVLGVLSRATGQVRPVPVAGGQLLRVDLRRYAPRHDDLDEWLQLWEDFRFDPSFALLITRDQLDFASKLGANLEKSGHDLEKSGHDLDRSALNLDVVRVNGLHLAANEMDRLQYLTHSQAPVVEWRYFAWRALSTIKDRGVYATVWGGRYYEFRGIRKGQGKGKATDLDVYLDQIGVGNVKAGLTADRLFDRLRSDQRVGIFRSGVTGKPRRVDWFHGPDSREGTGAISITHDLRDEDVDIGTHPVYNLVDIKAAAFEVITERGNGFHDYLIFDGEQKLLDEAGQNVVSDRTVPSPFPPRLQSGISCIACHETDGGDGWKSLSNDVKKMLAKRLDVFGDLSQHDRRTEDVVDRLAGLYAGDFSKALRRARDDYAETVLKCGGRWQGSKDQTDIVKVAMGHLTERTRGYWYQSVTPDVALAELGIECPKGEAAGVLTALLPPDPALDVGGYFLENAVIAALKEGVSVNRSDWDLARGFAAARAVNTLLSLKQTGRLR